MRTERQVPCRKFSKRSLNCLRPGKSRNIFAYTTSPLMVDPWCPKLGLGSWVLLPRKDHDCARASQIRINSLLPELGETLLSNGSLPLIPKPTPFSILWLRFSVHHSQCKISVRPRLTAKLSPRSASWRVDAQCTCTASITLFFPLGGTRNCGHRINNWVLKIIWTITGHEARVLSAVKVSCKIKRVVVHRITSISKLAKLQLPSSSTFKNCSISEWE